MVKKFIIIGIIISSCTPSRTLCYGNSSNVILNGLAGFCVCLEACCIYAITNDIYRRINQDPEAKPADLWSRPEACVGAAAPPTLCYAPSRSRYSYTSGQSRTYEKSFDEYAFDVSTLGLKIIAALLLIDYGIAAYQYCTQDSSTESDPHS